MTSFWNNAHNYKIGKPKNLKSLEASKLNGLFRISTICQGYLCLMEIDLTNPGANPRRIGERTTGHGQTTGKLYW
jgi:hypothetical protein